MSARPDYQELRALDARLAEAVFQWRTEPLPPDARGAHAGEVLLPPELTVDSLNLRPLGPYDRLAFVPEYTRDLAQAWLVVTALAGRGLRFALHGHEGRWWQARFHDERDRLLHGYSTGATAAVAIARAALAVVVP